MNRMTRSHAQAWILIHEALKPRPLTKKELGKSIGWPWETLTKYVNHFEQMRCLEWDECYLILGDKASLTYHKAKGVN